MSDQDYCPNNDEHVHAWTWLRDEGDEQICDDCGAERIASPTGIVDEGGNVVEFSA